MSIIGPRPALWNQNDLYEERAKYGANAVTPGLTGWAQINGRDELEIDVKASMFLSVGTALLSVVLLYDDESYTSSTGN